MPIQVLMPALSPTMEKGNLAKWLKKEGETIKSGDVIAEIETDKATMEVEATDEGTLGKILIPEGTADVAVNTPIATILADGESAADLAKAPAPAKQEKPAEAAPPAAEAKSAPTPKDDAAPAAPSAAAAPDAAADPNALVKGVGPTNTVLPDAEKPAVAPIQTNDIKPGENPAPPTDVANGKTKKPKVDQSDESSSKKKKKKEKDRESAGSLRRDEMRILRWFYASAHSSGGSRPVRPPMVIRPGVARQETRPHASSLTSEQRRRLDPRLRQRQQAGPGGWKKWPQPRHRVISNSPLRPPVQNASDSAVGLGANRNWGRW